MQLLNRFDLVDGHFWNVLVAFKYVFLLLVFFGMRAAQHAFSMVRMGYDIGAAFYSTSRCDHLLDLRYYPHGLFDSQLLGYFYWLAIPSFLLVILPDLLCSESTCRNTAGTYNALVRGAQFIVVMDFGIYKVRTLLVFDLDCIFRAFDCFERLAVCFWVVELLVLGGPWLHEFGLFI